MGLYYDSDDNNQALLLTETGGHWGDGAKAVLPMDAATTGQSARLNAVSCGSPGNCSAVGTYTDSSGSVQPLFVDEVSGVWQPGIEGVLPTDADTPNASPTVSAVSCSSAGNCAAASVG